MELRHKATITRRSAVGGQINTTTGRYELGGPDEEILTDEPCLVQDGGYRVVRDELGNPVKMPYPPVVLFHRSATAFRVGDTCAFEYEGYTRKGEIREILPVAMEHLESLIEVKWDEPLQT